MDECEIWRTTPRLQHPCETVKSHMLWNVIVIALSVKIFTTLNFQEVRLNVTHLFPAQVKQKGQYGEGFFVKHEIRV